MILVHHLNNSPALPLLDALRRGLDDAAAGDEAGVRPHGEGADAVLRAPHRAREAYKSAIERGGEYSILR